MASGPERVQAALDSYRLDTKVLRLPDSTRTAPEAAKAVGCDVAAIVKSLLFLADSEPVLVLCGGDRRVDTRLVAELTGASEVKMAPAEEVRRITGYAIGGVPPLGHPTRLTMLMDNGLLNWHVVYAAAGAHDALFPIDPQRLVDVTQAKLANLGEGERKT